MNRRSAKVLRSGGALAVVLPADWVRGNSVRAGDRLVVDYDCDVTISIPQASAASSARRKSPGTPAAQPAQPAETDEGGLVDAGS